jgi:hypothetical protein
MTDLADRIIPQHSSEPFSIEGAGEHALVRDTGAGHPPVGRPAGVFLSVLSGSIAMLAVGAAFGDHRPHTATAILIIVAWLELLVAALFFAKPSHSLVLGALALNTSLVIAWTVSAAIGVTSTNRAIMLAGVCVAGTAVLTTLVMLLRPGISGTWESSTTVLASVVPVTVVVATIAAIVAGVSAGPTTPSTASTQSAPPVLQTTVVVPGQNSSRFKAIASGNDTEKSELKPFVPLDPATQAKLGAQLALAAQAAQRFPTVADAKAAGMILAGGMAPGVGAHYQELSAASLQGINPDGSVNPSEPASWIYASTADNAPVVGVMYESLSKNPPSGFAGPNDHWHQHSNLCITFTNGKIGVPFAPDATVTPQECKDAHGVFMTKTVWMVHAWVVPGWQSPAGVFSHANTHVFCPGNTDLTDAIGFCLRQS